MPIEIRELVIKASVNEGGDSQNTVHENNTNSQEQSALITACVEQVLAILRARSER